VSTRTGGVSDIPRQTAEADRPRPLVLRMFSRRWILATLLVIAAMAVMVRLGIWQLDRLEKRRIFNARVLAQVNQPPLLLTGQALDADLASMEYRPVIVEGEYDPRSCPAQPGLERSDWRSPAHAVKDRRQRAGSPG
jgi:hypothetical protein